jgi:hypothetical protein
VLNLSNDTSLIEIVTGSGVSSITVQASWTDLNPNTVGQFGQTAVGGGANTVITTAATTPVVPSPPPNTDRNVKFLLITNTSISSCAVSVQHFDGTTTVPVFVPSFVLLPGWVLEYNTDGNGWVVYDTTGRIQVAVGSCGGGVDIAAGTQTATSGTVFFSNSNGVSFGMLGSSVITASALANINVSAGTTSNNLSAITFANSNNVSFGLNGSTMTASIAIGGTVSCFSQDADFVTNFPVGQAILSLQKLSLPMNLSATQLAMLADFRGNALSSGAVTVNHAVYTLSGSTASLASSGSRSISWGAPQYSNASGTRYRTIGVSYAMTPGDYLFAWWISTENNVTVNPFGRMAANIVGTFDGVENNNFLNGSSVSSVLAFPVSVAATDTNYARTGFSALLQPGAILFGTN